MLDQKMVSPHLLVRSKRSNPEPSREKSNGTLIKVSKQAVSVKRLHQVPFIGAQQLLQDVHHKAVT